MGRKSSNSAEYFSHDAKPGKTLFILEKKWKNDGYAFWFKLLEILAAAEGHFFQSRKLRDKEYFHARMNLPEGISYQEILDLLADLGNIDELLWKDHGIIWCQNLVDRLADTLYKNRNHAAPRKPCIENGIISPEILAANDSQEENDQEDPISVSFIPKGRKEEKEGRKIISPEIPPLLAPPSEPQEKDGTTKVDNLINWEGTPMIFELQAIHRKATGGAELKLSDGEMSELLALFRQHDGAGIVAAYRAHQAKKPGKAFKYFLEDFPEYFAKAPRQPGPLPPHCNYCGADGAHTATCNRPGNPNGLVPPDDFDDDFPEAK